MEKEIQNILDIQRQAYNKGHHNQGTVLDILASAKNVLIKFNHLNPAQQKLLDSINAIDDIKYSKRLCSRAHKAVRHLVVKLK